MGLLSSLSESLVSLSSTVSSHTPHLHQGHGGAPADEAALEALLAGARAEIDQHHGGVDTVSNLLRVGGEEPVTDRQLKRWLAARGWDPARAACDLAAHATWRAETMPDGRVADSEVKNELAQKKVLLQGLDRRGRGVVVFIGGNHAPNPDQSEVQRFFCYSTDNAIALADPELNPEGRIIFLFDVGDFGWKNFDVTGAKTLFKMIHAHYVERLAVFYFYNASAVLRQLYRLVYPFVDPVTRQKVVFLPHDAAEAAAILDADIGLHLLPPSLGGTAEPRPVEGGRAMVEEAARQRAASQQQGPPSEAPAAEVGAAPRTDCAAAPAAPADAAGAAAAPQEDAVVNVGGREADGAPSKQQSALGVAPVNGAARLATA